MSYEKITNETRSTENLKEILEKGMKAIERRRAETIKLHMTKTKNDDNKLDQVKATTYSDIVNENLESQVDKIRTALKEEKMKSEIEKQKKLER